MACGGRALAMLNENFRQNREVSQAFSAQLHQTGQAARQMNELLEKQKSQAQQLRLRLFDCIAQGYEGQENVLHFESQEDALGVRLLADAIAGKLSGTAAVFSGEDGKGYAFCLVSRTGDLRELTRAMTAVLHGRGGGKPVCQQGRVEATKAEIEAFFENQI
jgi:alanyl-tRNA synthetase